MGNTAPVSTCITELESPRTALREKETVTIDERLRLVHDALSDRFTMSEICARYRARRIWRRGRSAVTYTVRDWALEHP